MSGDAEQEYFSDGITEDITTDLSKISGLQVAARNAAFTYKGKPVKVQQVAQELGVDSILEGSVRKASSRVRVTGQLIDSRNGKHVWAERFDRDLTDIFAIQVACACTDLGDTDAALDLLERILPKAGQELQEWIKHDSDFDPLRSHPRFQKILDLVGRG